MMPGERERQRKKNLPLHICSCFLFSSPHNPLFFPHSLLNLVMEHKFMFSWKQMPSQLVYCFFFFSLSVIVRLLRAPKSIVCNKLAKMLLVIDKWAIITFSICTILEFCQEKILSRCKGSHFLVMQKYFLMPHLLACFHHCPFHAY